LDELLKDIKLNPKRYISFSAFDFGKKVFYVDGATAESEKKKKEKKK
ncbi:MAG TPA: MCE family protein, partial [Bacteroidales bacterium]|nr:MCE family protein [Bacteroidales bacterium]